LIIISIASFVFIEKPGKQIIISSYSYLKRKYLEEEAQI